MMKSTAIPTSLCFSCATPRRFGGAPDRHPDRQVLMAAGDEHFGVSSHSLERRRAKRRTVSCGKCHGKLFGHGHPVMFHLSYDRGLGQHLPRTRRDQQPLIQHQL